MQGFTHTPTLRQDASESAVSMPSAVVIAAAEEVDVLMSEDVTEDVGGEVEKVEEDAAKEFVEETAAHIKMGLASQMSPVTLKMHSGPHYQMIKEGE